MWCDVIYVCIYILNYYYVSRLNPHYIHYIRIGHHIPVIPLFFPIFSWIPIPPQNALFPWAITMDIIPVERADLIFSQDYYSYDIKYYSKHHSYHFSEILVPVIPSTYQYAAVVVVV